MDEKPKFQEADFLIKAKVDGKFQIIGRAWKKTGPYGAFISLSIGPKDNRQNYLMVKAPEKAPQQTTRTTPPKLMPERLAPPPTVDDFDL